MPTICYTSYPLESYIDTPKKLNIFLDLLATTCSAKNRLNINQGIGIRPNGNVNRRNAAMSRMAQLLGCPELIAHSENMKLQIDGKEMKGTFMREAKGEDLNKLTEHSPMLCSTEGSMNSLQLKKQLADLQILDYLCGNPDRHGGNLFYQYDRKKDGSVVMRSVCGIDNDSSFGEKLKERMRETLSLVNDYIYYKMNKKKGEEWREQTGRDVTAAKCGEDALEWQIGCVALL